jgi:hypothetical protein
MNYESKTTGKSMLTTELAAIEAAEHRPPQTFRLIGGALEKILENRRDPGREALVWQNAFFGLRPRTTVRMQMHFSVVNAPLTLHPELLDEVLKYIILPKEVVVAYREELTKRSSGRA